MRSGVRRRERLTVRAHFPSSKWKPWSPFLWVVLAQPGFSGTYLTTQTLAATVSPYGKVSVAGGASLATTGTRFGIYTGSLLISYWARTTDAGSGSMTLQAASDFSPAGGPTVSAVTYACSGATLGTNCSGTQTLSTTVQSPVVTLPAGACTGGGGSCTTADPNTVQLNFAAPNKPAFKTGGYSTTVTITISTI